MTDVNKYMLQQIIAEVESKIAEASSQKKELEENAKNAKTEVHQSVGCHLEHLRQREVQLTRQVDALIGHQSSLLQLQLARLYQELGSLRAAQAYGHQTEIMASTDRVSLIPVRHLQYVAPTELALSSAIQSFGRFEATRGPSWPSVLLLPDEEAYEDADHQLMHKNLLQEKIQWTFPKPPPKKDEWNSQSMKIEDFEMSDCESIELLCPSESSDKTLWLLNKKSSSKSCMCQEKGTIEIENLDALSCTNHHHPNKEESMETFSIPDVDSTCQSQNGNKCSSFRNCNCTENCLLTHLREQTKRLWLEEPQKRQDCINNTLKEVLRVERSVWLNKSAPSNDNSEWLLKSATKTDNCLVQNVSESCQSLKKQMKELYFESGNSGWLSSQNVSVNQGWISRY